MWFLYVLAAILLLLCMPVWISFEYDGAFKVSVRYFIRFVAVDTSKPKKAKKEAKKEIKQAGGKKTAPKESPKGDAKDRLRFLWEFLKSSRHGVRMILKHLKVSRLNLHIVVASGDAAQTAVNYGKWCAGVYSAVTLLKNWVSFGKIEIDILPDFDREENEYRMLATIRLIPFAVLTAGGRVLFGLLTGLVGKQKTKQNEQDYVKGGALQ
ncbi:DUF2953 domain-containing protein [Candidatus Soleaferrea massiliensis]|uniref:DUF2953 domain-containing protein n=1 Tax=Candidatus Soleaferrea massiliensis TaxID=1470354 RepID=UPI00058F5EBA|nr:DUF2953 domain-containing protein [Candidatus Soleaferrea massiliensis]